MISSGKRVFYLKFECTSLMEDLTQGPLRLSESENSLGDGPAPASLGSLELADGSPTFLQQSMARYA